MRNKTLKKISSVSLAALIALTGLSNATINIAANEGVVSTATDVNGYNVLGSVTSVTKDENKVTFNIATGERVRFTFLEQNVFRMYMAPAGEDFQEYPTPNNSSHTATITYKRDEQYDTEYNVKPTVTEGETAYEISTEKIKIEVTKNSLVKLMKKTGEVIWEETAPLKYKTGSTVQTLKTDENEYFFGGGTQNGRFTHKGEIVEIVNSNNWVNGGVASPNPFYWSTDGYGVVRNTWKPGSYDFGKTEANTVTTTHKEARFDAYYFVDDTPTDILKDYYELTGTPVELPEYASYLGHLNCYNRDFWVEVPEGTSGAVKLGDTWYKESQSDNGGKKETLLGEDNRSAQQIIEDHKANDMPLGWFLPNDGYGCGYGQGTSQEEDLENLGAFADYAQDKGIQTGLWTQSNLWPADPSNPQKGERDIYKEVEAGVTSTKTDVAWVGAGYSMALNGVSVAYDAIASRSNYKPNIVTLDGWAGTQRYGGIWTGDQYGGQWEYIRFHIPTYIGTGLSGQPNVGSDMDGIFGGKNPTVSTRDFQWKAFTTFMLDMDGWGSNQKTPWALGEDGTSINRAYLKLKAQLMPYINTISHEATANNGLPMLRAMFLEEKNAYTLGTATQYQYMWGDNFLVAPIYKETKIDAAGNDIRNDIYLPSTSDIWVDYFTGKQYRGNQVLNDFAAPLWKLPVFVKNGSIIPMYPENNNPEALSETNVDGLDRSQRIVEFYPHGSTKFNLFEDDGKTLGGGTINTLLTSNVEGTTATLKAEAATGSYSGMVKERSNEFIVNVSKAPTAVKGTVKGKDVTFTEVTSQEAYDKAEGNVYFYNAKPSVFVKDFATEGSTYANMTETTTPKLYVKSNEKVDITANSTTVVVEGFENTQDLGKDELNLAVNTPTNVAEKVKTDAEITINWEKVAGANTYDVEADGIIYRNISTNEYTQYGLKYSTDHTYRVRTVTKEGYSEWSPLLTIQTADDPYRNVPKDMDLSFEGGTPPAAYGGKFENIIDNDNNSEYSSAAGGAWKDKSLIIDMNKSYLMDKIEYICRQNMANGAVQEFGLSYSNDGVNWKTYGTLTNDVKNSYIHKDNEDGRVFMHQLDEPFRARYLKFTVKKSTGGFLQAYELRPYFVDGSKGMVVGDVNNSGHIDDNDLVFYENYVGLIPADADWEYAAGLGNIDNNDIIDAFDISFVARQLGAKIDKAATGVSGKIEIVPSKTDIKAGDTVTLDVYGIGLKNVNAFDIEIPVDKDLFEITNFGSPSLSTMFMRNFSKTRFHSDNTIDNYVSFTNVGKQDLISGTGSIAKVTLTATADFTWDTKATRAILVGQDLSTTDAIIDATVTPTPPETESILGKNDIAAVTFKNDVSDNVDPAKLWQQTNWKDLLLDGDLASMAEFKWFTTPTSITDEVKLPTDMTFEFGKVQPLTTVKVYNRTSSNGRVTSIKAVAYKGDTAYDLGTFATAQDVYEFNVPAEATEGIDRVVITPLTSVGNATGVASGSEANRMLTLREIQFVTNSAVKATGITFNKDSKTTTSINGLAQVSAKVAPTNVSNPFYNVTSSDESIAKVIKVPTETDYYYVVQGVRAGTVTLTATSEDGAFTDTMEFSVVDGVDTTLINEKFAAFEALRTNLYTKESYDEAKKVYDEAKALLETESVTQDKVDAITVKLVKAIDALEFRGSNPDQPSSANLISQDKLARFDESSMSAAEKEDASFTIDGKANTIWHSNYSSSYKLPQYVTIDLGAEYLLEQVDMLPRQNTTNGHITHYRIEVSSDEGENKTFIPVVEGFFKHDGTGLVAPEVAKEVKFDATSARYVRFIAIESLGGTPNSYASIAELNFYGVEAMPSIEEAIKDGNKIARGEEKYTTSSFAKFSAAFAVVKELAESSDATASEVNKALAEMYAAINELDTKASDVLLGNLAKNVDAFKALEADYTVEEFADMKAAIVTAEAILEKALDDIASKDASLANNALLMAKVELGKLAGTDQLLDNLAMVIETANETLATEENIRPSSIKAVQDAVAAGQALIDNGSTDRVAIKASIESITKAVQELYEIVDKTELKELIALAESITGNFTEATAKELADAVAAAKVVSTNDDATTMDVADAHNRLSNAILNLKVTANKEALATQIAITEKIIANIANYVPSTVAGIDTVLAKANEVFADESAKQAQVDAMVKELTTANLKARMKADKKALETAINRARSVDVTGFTASSVMNLRNAIANAERVFANENATQDEVNISVIAIDHAISGLSKVETPDGSASNRPGNTTGGTTVRTPVRNNTGGTTERPATPNEDVTTDVEEPKEDVKIEDQETPQAIVKTPTSNTNNWLLAGAMGVILLAGAGFFLVSKKKSSK